MGPCQLPSMGGGSSTAGIVNTLLDATDERVKEVAASKLCEKAKKYNSYTDYIQAIADNAGKSLIGMLEKGTEKGKNHAAATLSYLALNAKNKKVLADFGAIPALVKLLKEGTPELKGAAAAALANLPSGNQKNQDAMASAGVIPPLVEMVKTGLGEAKGWAASGLGNMCLQHKKNQLRVAEAGGIDAILELAKGKAVEPVVPKPPLKFEFKVFDIIACRRCRRRMWKGLKDLDTSEGGGSRNMELAARALSSLAYESAENQAKIIKADGVETLLGMAKDGSSRDAMEAMRAIAIVWGKDDQVRERIINGAGVPTLVGKVQSATSDDECKGAAANMLARLAHEDASMRDTIATHEGIPALVKAAHSENPTTKVHAIKALKEVCNDRPENKQLIEDAGGKVFLDRIKAQEKMTFRELTKEEHNAHVKKVMTEREKEEAADEATEAKDEGKTKKDANPKEADE